MAEDRGRKLGRQDSNPKRLADTYFWTMRQRNDDYEWFTIEEKQITLPDSV
jgi:hypothetical protein